MVLTGLHLYLGLHVLARGVIDRLRGLERDAQWGTREMDAAPQERLRQFLASRSEIAAGDRMVLQALRGKAREQQRYRLGLPLVIAGAVGAGISAPWRRPEREAAG